VHPTAVTTVQAGKRHSTAIKLNSTADKNKKKKLGENLQKIICNPCLSIL
jgi:hypothetical protein